MKIKNEQGEEIDVFTAEELEQQKREAIDKYKEENPDKTEEMEAIQGNLSKKEEELEALNEELSKLKGKDHNFENLRRQKDSAESKIEELRKSIDDKLETTKKEVLEGVLKDYYDEELNSLYGDDDELKAKIEKEYKRLSDSGSTKSEVSKKLRDAYLLATKDQLPDFNIASITSGGVRPLNIKSEEKKFSDDEKALGRKLGLSEEDFKKYQK